MDIIQANILLDSKAILGEGVFWHPEQQLLYWVDIEGMALYSYSPELNVQQKYELGHRVGTAAPVNGGGILLALENGIVVLDPESQAIEYKLNPEAAIKGNRYNDGKCDAAGRFWVGSMSLTGEKNAGTLYCIDHNFAATAVKKGVTIPNGIAWSAGGDAMYFIDTALSKVFVYACDEYNGKMENPLNSFDIPEKLGYPDGMTIDNEGMLWIAMWGGGCVARFHPVTGRLLQRIDVPAPNVTSCAFGGPYMDRLYIITAQYGLTDKQLKEYPFSGAVFYADPKVGGRSVNYFGKPDKAYKN